MRAPPRVCNGSPKCENPLLMMHDHRLDGNSTGGRKGRWAASRACANASASECTATTRTIRPSAEAESKKSTGSNTPLSVTILY